jgi:hypothetical protein
MFELYAPLLMVSGLLLVVNAILPWQTVGARVLSILVGLGFFGYGAYLEFIFTGGHYIVFYYAFAVPVLLIIQSLKGFRAWQAQKAQRAQQPGIYPGAPVAAPPQQFGQPPQFGAPQQQPYQNPVQPQ